MILPGVGTAVLSGSGASYPITRGSVQVSTDTGSSDFSPTLPTHAVGDTLLVFCTAKGSATLSATGWTKKAEISSLAADAGNLLTLFTKTATTTSETITISGFNGGTHAAHAYAIAGGNGVEAATAANIDPPNLAPSWGAALNLWLVAASTFSAPASGPAGFTHGVQTSATENLTTLDKEDSSSSLNPATFSDGGANPATMTVAVRPAG